MLTKTLLFLCLILTLFFSCQKDVKTGQTVLNSSATAAQQSDDYGMQVLDTVGHWEGSYAGYYGPYTTVPDSLLIKNGVAKDPRIGQNFSFSNCTYAIPPMYNFTGDSVTFEARVKNPTQGSQSGYDVVLQLHGDQHDAEIHFVGVQSGQPYSRCIVGNAAKTNLPQLVHLFTDFQTVKFIMKDYKATVYLDTTQLVKLAYGAENSIGKLLSVNIAGKGYATVTSADLRRSFGRKYIFTEDFNADGQSHTIYYHQN